MTRGHRWQRSRASKRQEAAPAEPLLALLGGLSSCSAEDSFLTRPHQSRQRAAQASLSQRKASQPPSCRVEAWQCHHQHRVGKPVLIFCHRGSSLLNNVRALRAPDLLQAQKTQVQDQ